MKTAQILQNILLLITIAVYQITFTTMPNFLSIPVQK